MDREEKVRETIRINGITILLDAIAAYGFNSMPIGPNSFETQDTFIILTKVQGVNFTFPVMKDKRNEWEKVQDKLDIWFDNVEDFSIAMK